MAQTEELESVSTPLDEAVTSISGAAALQDLGAITVGSSGVSWIRDEGINVGQCIVVGPFAMTVYLHLVQPRSN